MTEMFDEDRLVGCLTTEDYVIDEHWNYMFEIESSRVEGLLPLGVTAKEARPGRSLVNFGYMLFDASQIGGREDAIELTLSIIIDPDLSLDMPMPRMCVYDIHIGSNCGVFLEHENTVQKLNGVHMPTLRREVAGDNEALRIVDDEGEIAHLRNPEQNPEYNEEMAFGQYISQHPDGLHRGVFVWHGIGSEQQAEGDCGGLRAHRFCAPIPVDDVEGCYTQMFLAPGTKVVFRSFEPVRVR